MLIGFLQDMLNVKTKPKTADPCVIEANEWITQHTYAAVEIPTQYLRSPGDKFAARPTDWEFVKSTVNGIQHFHSTPDAVTVVVFVDSVADLPPRPLGTKTVLSPAMIEQFGHSEQGFYMSAGNHSGLAWQTLFKKWKKNPRFRQLECTPIVCVNSAEVRRMLRNYGRSDNAIRSHRKKTTIAEQVESLRKDYLEGLLECQENNVTDEKEISRVIGQYKRTAWAHMGLKREQGGQLWALATRSEQVYDLMMRIFQGPPAGTKPRFKPPSGASAFVSMGGVPDHVLVDFLTPVVDQQQKPSYIGNSCNMYKLGERVMEAVLEKIQESANDSDLKWETVSKDKDYDPVCSPTFTKRWIDLFFQTKLRQKDPLTPNFFNDVRDKLVTIRNVKQQKFRNARVQEQLKKVLTCHCFIFFLKFFFQHMLFHPSTELD